MSLLTGSNHHWRAQFKCAQTVIGQRSAGNEHNGLSYDYYYYNYYFLNKKKSNYYYNSGRQASVLLEMDPAVCPTTTIHTTRKGVVIDSFLVLQKEM